MPPNRFESEVESFLEGSHGDRTHIKRADHPRLHHYAGRYFLIRERTVFSPYFLCACLHVRDGSLFCFKHFLVVFNRFARIIDSSLPRHKFSNLLIDTAIKGITRLA